VQISRKHRPLNGITRADFDDELKSEESSREPVHVGVVMLGIYDRQSIRLARDRATLGSPEWREEYGRRVDRFIKTMKRRGVALYWVGQPVMRRYEVNDPAQMMNDIVREKTYLNGVKYVDIVAHFADEQGNYAPYGPDIAGANRLLREADGINFTWAGNRKLAHFVEQEIKRDLAQARNDRAIPLAGTEAEQQRISALRPRAAPDDAGWKGTITAARDPKAASQKSPAPPAQAPATEASGEQKADNSRIAIKRIGASGREETVTIDLLRPAIPSSVILLMTRKDSGERAAQMGDVIADDVGGGIVVQSSITPAASGPGVNRGLLSSQAPYYQVMIKGDRLPPKIGRADDFSWPKAEPDISEPAHAPRKGRQPPPGRTTPRS
jgi:hypothetical protein